MGRQLAVTEDGSLKPVAEFTEREKWWCDGEDCGGCFIAGPHVHPMSGPALPVDLLTGWTVADD